VHDAAVALCQFCGSDMPPYFHFRFHQLSVIGKYDVINNIGNRYRIATSPEKG